MLNHFPKQIFTMRRMQWTPVWPVLDLSRRASIGAFLGLIWLVDFFIISHIFLFLCVPCKFWMDASQAFWILFYWVQSVFVLLSVHVLELCYEAQLSDLELVEADWPPPGAVLPESSTWCPELGLFSTQAGGDTPRSQRALGETSHHFRLLFLQLWAGPVPTLLAARPGSPICESGTRGPVCTCPSQGLLSCMARGPLSEKCYFIYFVFCL